MRAALDAALGFPSSAMLAAVPCNGPAMLAAAKEETYLSLPTVHAPFLARFASTARADWKKDASPWAFLTEDTFRSHFEMHAGARTASDVDGTARFVIHNWKKNRYLIVLRPDDERANRLPLLRSGSKSFDTGVFRGWFLVVDSTDARVVCQKRLAVDSSDNVSSGQSFTRNPQSALNEDFEDRFEAAIEAALPPKVKSSNNMGALLK